MAADDMDIVINIIADAPERDDDDDGPEPYTGSMPELKEYEQPDDICLVKKLLCVIDPSMTDQELDDDEARCIAGKIIDETYSKDAWDKLGSVSMDNKEGEYDG